MRQFESLRQAGRAELLDPYERLDRIAQAERLQIIDLGAAHVELGAGPDIRQGRGDPGPVPELGDRDIGIFEIARVEDDALAVDLGIAHAKPRREGETRPHVR
jgi:hypothetical protein